MQKLYAESLSRENLEKAIKYVIVNEDYIEDNQTKYYLAIEHREQLIIYIKNILRRYKKPLSKIEKGYRLFDYHCEYEEYRKYSFFALVAQRAVYQVLISRLNIQCDSPKEQVIKAINILQTAKMNYCIHIDLTTYIQNLDLYECIAVLKKKEIKDLYFLKTVKHILWQSKTYNGIGLDINNELSQLILDIYFQEVLDNQINQIIQTSYLSYRRDFNRHKDDYLEWIKSKGKKLYAHYFRKSNEALIICHSRIEQQYMSQVLKQISNVFVTECTYNRFKFCGFYAKKKRLEKDYLEVRIANITKLQRVVKSYKFNTRLEFMQFKKWIMFIMSYYDIVNDISDFLNYIINRLYHRSKHISNLQKLNNCSVYYYICNNNAIYMDLFDIRKATKISYKEYLFNKQWIRTKEYIEPWKDETYTAWNLYRQALYVKQQGKDILSHEYLNFTEMRIHHLQERKNDGKNRINNLILVSADTHYAIHNSDKYQKQLKKLIKSSNI